MKKNGFVLSPIVALLLFQCLCAQTTTWSTISSGTNGMVLAIAVSGSNIYVGGQFSTAGGVAAKNIAKWDGTSWSALGAGANDMVRAIGIIGNDVYAGGDFTSVDGVSVNHIAKWNGSQWQPLGSGFANGVINGGGRVHAIGVSSTHVYVGGDFTTAGGENAAYIAKWDTVTSTWSQVGSGTNGIVYSIATNGTNIYLGGSFSQVLTPASIDADHLAMWNGSTWTTFGTVSGGGDVTAVAVDGTSIYAGGVGLLCKWDGTSWSSLSGDLGSGYVYIGALEVSASELYVGGVFSTAGGNSANNIAKWNGSSWASIGASGSYGVNDMVYALKVQPSTHSMIVGGSFTQAYAISDGSRIARFTDSSNPLPVELIMFTASARQNSVELKWKTATEINNYGFEIQKSVIRNQSSEKIWSKVGFIEGNGTTNSTKEYSFVDKNVNGKNIYRLKQIDRDGQFKYSTTVEVKVNSTPGSFSLHQNYPNPFNPSTVINYQLPVNSFVSLKVYNIVGREVATLVNEVKEAGSYDVQFNASQLSSGVYFYKIQTENFTETKKLLLMK